MRITGLATGMDIDALVKSQMQPYRIKIDTQQQKKDILEMKQQLYRDVLKESRDFYDKYFDVSKTDSILLSKNWATSKFTSSNESLVSVSGTSEAKKGNYTITGSAATAAKSVVTEGIKAGEKVTINGKEFTLSGKDNKEIAKNLNDELSKAGMKVTVKYSDMAGTESGNKSGFIFESTVLGKDGSFTLGGTISNITVDTTKGNNDTVATIKGENFTIANLRKASEFKIGDKVITLELKDEYTADDIMKILNEKLAENKIEFKASQTEGKITLTSSKTGVVDEVAISLKDKEGNAIGGIAFENGKEATSTVYSMDLSEIEGKVLFIGGEKIDLSEKGTKNTAEYLNEMFKEKGIEGTAEIKDGKLLLTTKATGESAKLEFSIVEKPIEGFINVEAGKDANMIIKDEMGGVYTHTGNSNTITLDGVNFKFSGEIKEGESVTIKGESNITPVKDKVIAFINDYNSLIEKLNTLTSEKRNKNYEPLTEEQKKEMSEDEIKLWNDKVKQGQLYKDNDLTSIANALKSSMRGFVEGTGLNLEKIGIEPVADYQGTKNGTFTINEAKLTEALEKNSEEVMKLFTANPTGDKIKDSEKGIAQRLKEIVYKETVTVTSNLVKKAGVIGTSTVANNEITKAMEDYDKKMKELETDFARREQALYSKWATVETMMNNLNSQQSYLTSQLGM